MREGFKTYYLKNGRLDLSLLDDHQKEKEQEAREIKMSKIYVDDKISSILEEMGNCFLEEEKS